MKVFIHALLYFICLTTLFVSSKLHAEVQEEGRVKKEILSMINETRQKINQLDIEGALQHIHPYEYNEFSHIPQKKLAKIDRKSLLSVCKVLIPSLKLKIGTTQDLNIVVQGDMAFATYHSEEYYGNSSPIKVRRTEIYIREDRKWTMIHAHRSIMSDE